MKDFWFFFPLKYLLTALGGIPVPRGKKTGSLTESIIRLFKERDYVNIAVTPEGTRKPTDKWKTGFLYIALGAGVPIELAVIDYKQKQVLITQEFFPEPDINEDLAEVKKYYSDFRDAARYPEKFLI